MWIFVDFETWRYMPHLGPIYPTNERPFAIGFLAKDNAFVTVKTCSSEETAMVTVNSLNGGKSIR